jgi:hypothetical protein
MGTARALSAAKFGAAGPGEAIKLTFSPTPIRVRTRFGGESATVSDAIVQEQGEDPFRHVRRQRHLQRAIDMGSLIYYALRSEA